MTLDDLKAAAAEVRADLSAEGVVGVWIRHSFEAALATVVGGFHLMFKDLVTRTGDRGIPSLATGEGVPGSDLVEWGVDVKGVPVAVAGTAAGGVILNGITGSTQAAGSVLSGPTGLLYTLDDDVTTDGDPDVMGAGAGSVTAAGAGPEYDLAPGAPLTISSPATGMASAAAVSFNGITGGTTGDTTESYRAKVLAAFRKGADIGTSADWQLWTLAADPSVSRVWVYSCGRLGNEPGRVLILFACAGATPIPSGGLVSTVTAALSPKVRTGSLLTVAAPTGQATTYTIALDPAQVSTANWAAIEAALVDVHSQVNPGGTLRNIDIRGALARTSLTWDLRSINGDNTGLSDVTAADNVTLPYKGTVTHATW